MIAAAPVSDTIKEVGDDGRTVVRTLDRSRLWAVQTPQVFRRAALERALAEASDELLAAATDDAWLIERAGGAVRVVESDAREPEDHDRDRPAGRRAAVGARSECGDGAMISTGIGYDCHRFAAGRRLVLGGVEIEHDRGLAGHSDADVLTHAIIDALLGAAALGDIGQHFPDTDERYRGADSLELLRATVALLAERGARSCHVDATVVIERPAVSPRTARRMRAALAGALGIDAGARQRQGDPGRGDGVRRPGRGGGGARDRYGQRMNWIHNLICSSDWWRGRVEQKLVPWGLAGVELGDGVLEIGPGFGATTGDTRMLIDPDQLPARLRDAGLSEPAVKRSNGSFGFRALKPA